MKILHVIKNAGFGGASRSLCAIAGELIEREDCQIAVASLTPVVEGGEMFADKGIRLIDSPSESELWEEARLADVVHVEWWNSPQINQFLRSRLPPMRLLLWVHVAGDRWPHLLTDQLVEIADFVVLGCPYAAQSPPIQGLNPEERERKTAVIYSTADFGRLEPFDPREHQGFNVGYIGAASFKKMHPSFVSMSASIRIPEARFIVCGRGETALLRSQAETLGVSGRFDFRGYVHDIKPVLERLDVYGYPICDNPGAELNIQEAMYAGVPPVVFGLGGLRDVVQNGKTGLVVDSEAEYVGAVEHLYQHPAERKRLGQNASEHARRKFGGANSAAKLHAVYQRLSARPKRRRRWVPMKLADHCPSIGEGALRLIESVHSQAPFFLRSARSRKKSEILEADRRIARASPREFTMLRVYRDYYPEDPHLNFWYGLAAENAGDHLEAQHAFRKAIAPDSRPERARGHLACSLERSGDPRGADSLVEEVFEAAPEIARAAVSDRNRGSWQS